MKARFWDVTARSTWVKLSLEEGQTADSYNYTPTEEGYNAQHIQWRREGDLIYRDATDIGKDCDGRLARCFRDKAHITQLKAVEVSGFSLVPYEEWPLNIKRPGWQECFNSQRDYAAEARGY